MAEASRRHTNIYKTTFGISRALCRRHIDAIISLSPSLAHPELINRRNDAFPRERWVKASVFFIPLPALTQYHKRSTICPSHVFCLLCQMQMVEVRTRDPRGAFDSSYVNLKYIGKSSLYYFLSVTYAISFTISFLRFTTEFCSHGDHVTVKLYPMFYRKQRPFILFVSFQTFFNAVDLHVT
jgi:hypothetical protein